MDYLSRYTISQTQSPGVFFNAKEMLYVKSGGSDSTSLDYFRLFWRLATKDENKCVKVPGTFSLNNFALPIAPEPFTNLVLSCLMPGTPPVLSPSLFLPYFFRAL